MALIQTLTLLNSIVLLSAVDTTVRDVNSQLTIESCHLFTGKLPGNIGATAKHIYLDSARFNSYTTLKEYGTDSLELVKAYTSSTDNVLKAKIFCLNFTSTEELQTVYATASDAKLLPSSANVRKLCLSNSYILLFAIEYMQCPRTLYIWIKIRPANSSASSDVIVAMDNWNELNVHVVHNKFDPVHEHVPVERSICTFRVSFSFLLKSFEGENGGSTI
uniref:Uncharacterized protein n=1 Tax=Anopheles maculatus TaxID=74869 RepID=A0A182SY46_9DIPT